MERDKLLKKIMVLDFAAVDLGLYLNTHPQDERAISLYNKVVKKADDCRINFEKNFGPLCSFRSTSRNKNWTWVDNPWPWSKKFNKNL